MLTKFIPSCRSYNVVLIGIVVLRTIELRQYDTGYVPQSFCVKRRNVATMYNPVRQVSQLYVQHRSLNVIQQRRIPMIMKLSSVPVLSVKSQQGSQPGHFRIIGGNGSAITNPP